MFEKILIANRGEIAVRIARACRELGVRSVGVYSTADGIESALRYADEAVCIGPPRAAKSYQNAAAIVEAARMTGADAVHPGYGFLAEDPDFAEICTVNDLSFIGPRPEVMEALGDKAATRALMLASGLPLMPGSIETLATLAQAKAVADDIGYPVIIKAAAGGGGRGMTVVREARDLPEAYRLTRATAQAVFGDNRVYVERYLDKVRHVEVQLLCDAEGDGIHLGTRDCSVQRRYQKLIEEAPGPGLSPEVVAAMCEGAVSAALAVGFSGLGTAEFLVDEDENHYFMEINSRIQVEHPVTEMITGIDLVHEQLHVAAGLPLRHQQHQIDLRGVAMECRVNAENPARGFAPAPGLLERFVPPGGPFTRVDTHCHTGRRIGSDYDALLAKVIVWAPDRDLAIARMERALHEFEISGPGVSTTIPFLQRVLADAEFRKAQHSAGLGARLAEEAAGDYEHA